MGQADEPAGSVTGSWPTGVPVRVVADTAGIESLANQWYGAD